MLVLISAVFVASLAGSAHCVGMCGPFILLASNASSEKPNQGEWVNHAAYHFGRLMTYLVFGVCAGLIGAAVDWGGSAAGLRRTATVCAGGAMIFYGLVVLAKPWFPIGKWSLASWAHRHLSKPFAIIVKWRGARRALALGIITTLMPCGWLYAFTITAAGTAHPVWGAITMLVFWMGSIPLLTAFAVGIQKLPGRLRTATPYLTAIILIATGYMTMMRRANAHFDSVPSSQIQATDPIVQVQALTSHEPACCRDPDEPQGQSSLEP
jgi:uncharacterized protein